MAQREWLCAALSSARELNKIIQDLTEEEIVQALDLESASQRRTAIIERLIVRLTHVKEENIRTKLQRKYAPWLLEKIP